MSSLLHTWLEEHQASVPPDQAEAISVIKDSGHESVQEGAPSQSRPHVLPNTVPAEYDLSDRKELSTKTQQDNATQRPGSASYPPFGGPNGELPVTFVDQTVRDRVAATRAGRSDEREKGREKSASASERTSGQREQGMSSNQASNLEFSFGGNDKKKDSGGFDTWYTRWDYGATRSADTTDEVGNKSMREDKDADNGFGNNYPGPFNEVTKVTHAFGLGDFDPDVSSKPTLLQSYQMQLLQLDQFNQHRSLMRQQFIERLSQHHASAHFMGPAHFIDFANCDRRLDFTRFRKAPFTKLNDAFTTLLMEADDIFVSCRNVHRQHPVDEFESFMWQLIDDLGLQAWIKDRGLKATANAARFARNRSQEHSSENFPGQGYDGSKREQSIKEESKGRAALLAAEGKMYEDKKRPSKKFRASTGTPIPVPEPKSTSPTAQTPLPQTDESEEDSSSAKRRIKRESSL